MTESIPAPNTPEEAQALIDSLRKQFKLSVEIPDPDMQQGLDDYRSKATWIPEDLGEFLHNNRTGVLSALEVEKQRAAQHAQKEMANIPRWMDAYNITDALLEGMMEDGWTAEVVATHRDSGTVSGGASEVVSEFDEFETLGEAHEWARITAREVARTTDARISARLVNIIGGGMDRESELCIPLTLSSDDLAR